jgi:hypothetical protein
MMNSKLNRRTLLTHAVACGVCAAAADAEAANPKLDPNDPVATKLGYVEDAKKVDVKKFPAYKAGQTCANCMLVQLRYGFYRPCTLFPGKVVSAKGWCSGWVLKTYG